MKHRQDLSQYVSLSHSMRFFAESKLGDEVSLRFVAAGFAIGFDGKSIRLDPEDVCATLVLGETYRMPLPLGPFRGPTGKHVAAETPRGGTPDFTLDTTFWSPGPILIPRRQSKYIKVEIRKDFVDDLRKTIGDVTAGCFVVFEEVPDVS